jgi:acetyl-CoA carboxylase biotin carboxyl carrier protein
MNTDLLEKIRHLVHLVEENKLTELTVEDKDISIVIKAESPTVSNITVPMAQATTLVEVQPCESPVTPEEPSTETASADHLVKITSPMIGVFYRAPSPDSPPYIEVGDEVEEGQTIGLIEAMKVFSEVPSEVSGRVVEIPAENGKLVQQGDVLVVIDTSSNK